MSSSRTLRDVTHTTAIGLSSKDVRVIKDVMAISTKLKSNFDFNHKMKLTTADIIFANAENDMTMRLFVEHGDKLQAVPIFLYDNESTYDDIIAKFPDAMTLSTPIRMNTLTEVLSAVVSTPALKPKSRFELTMKADCFKILVVDDSFPVRKYLEQKLPELIHELMTDLEQNLEFDIQYASSGKEAVDKIKRARGAYDIVFLDIMMDDVDGYKICKWIKKVKSSIDVVMLTSKSSPIDRVRANMSGSDNFLSKPPKDDHLKKVILKTKKFETLALLE